MEIGESIAISIATDWDDNKCLFKETHQKDCSTEDEGIPNDDRKGVLNAQANNGGTLGENLTKKSNGSEGTWEGTPSPPPECKATPANDSHRKNGEEKVDYWMYVSVPGTATIPEGDYPFTVAAHHLIPGNASLYTGKCDLVNYMTKGKTVTANNKSWKIKHNIGYNVNGAHNGVWLPGNYAIRKPASPTGETWGKMGNEDWQLNYVAACCKEVKGQFHDAHGDYNGAVLRVLNKIAAKLQAHQCTCDDCRKKGVTEVPPPYAIKERLYALSGYFRTAVTLPPAAWRAPFFTSDRWSEIIFGDSTKPSKVFVKAWKKSSCTVINNV
ncbi:MAG: hypothetical protein RL497_3144 [Pseudomonadota bacterium]|jgi:hypothetical protein